MYIIYDYNKPRQSGYLQKGVWAQCKIPYRANNLKNASAYSYSEFVKLIQADTLSSLEKIASYTELWIVTPTEPLKKEELQILKKWVFLGGHLILVADHTDLYGHARCANQVADLFNCKINYSATFDKHDGQIFRDAWGRRCVIKTGTALTGCNLFPTLAHWLWEENAYYANDNFFGPLAPSEDDDYGIKILLGQTIYGLGKISFLEDSTFFANFSVYQPYVANLIEAIINASPIVILFVILPYIFICLLLLVYSRSYNVIYVTSILSIFCIPFYTPHQLDYGRNPQIWSGKAHCMFENGCPYLNISTAYSLASLADRKPLWKDNVSPKIEDVIWVDSIPPQNKNWRWIKVEDRHTPLLQDSSIWNIVYENLNVQIINNCDSIYKNYSYLYAPMIFNDCVMNDWWYDDGITSNRQSRINAWIDWLNKKSFNSNMFQSEDSLFTKEMYPAILYVEKREGISLQIPKPLKNSGEIYLGQGIAGKIISRNGSLSILGLHQYSENIFCPKIWVIDYHE